MKKLESTSLVLNICFQMQQRLFTNKYGWTPEPELKCNPELAEEARV